MNCVHCGRGNKPVETYTFSCTVPSYDSRELELDLCLDCFGEIRLDTNLELVSAGTHGEYTSGQ